MMVVTNIIPMLVTIGVLSLGTWLFFIIYPHIESEGKRTAFFIIMVILCCLLIIGLLVFFEGIGWIEHSTGSNITELIQ